MGNDGRACETFAGIAHWRAGDRQHRGSGSGNGSNSGSTETRTTSVVRPCTNNGVVVSATTGRRRMRHKRQCARVGGRGETHEASPWDSPGRGIPHTKPSHAVPRRRAIGYVLCLLCRTGRGRGATSGADLVRRRDSRVKRRRAGGASTEPQPRCVCTSNDVDPRPASGATCSWQQYPSK